MAIPFVDLAAQYAGIKKEINPVLQDILNRACFIGGEEVRLFEKEFSAFLGSSQCVTVNSGTDALILGIRALGIGPGDEVLVPANTFIATALGVSENGARPVFVDIDPDDYGLNLDDLRKKITSRTKAVIAVHLYGQPEKIADISSLIAKHRHIHLIEDACQAHGAEYRQGKAGTFGRFAAFSFYPGKNLGAYGDGGALVTGDPVLAGKFRMLREYGQKKKYYHETTGINSRLDTIQAAVLRVKLKHLAGWNTKRRQHAATYTELLHRNVPSVQTPRDQPQRGCVYHLYVIRTEKRDGLLEYLNRNNIQTLIHYPVPLHLQTAYAYLGYKPGDLPAAERISREILSLPIYPELTEKQIRHIVSVIKDFFHPAV